ncbi:MAG: tetratricopeptide repeat protein, partial [Planctomycetota bacterium]
QRGHIAFRLNRLPDSLADYTQAMKLAGDREVYRGLLVHRAAVYFCLEDLGKALQDLERMREFHPKDNVVRHWIAVVHFNRGNFPEAETSWRALEATLPTVSPFLYLALLEGGKGPEAKAYLETQAKAPPADLLTGAYWGLASGTLSEGEAFTKIAPLAMEQRSAACLLFGTYFLRKGRPRQARRCLASAPFTGNLTDWGYRWCRRALKAIPPTPATAEEKRANALFVEGERLRKRRDIKGAIRKYTEAVSTDPNNLAALGKRAWMYVQVNRPDLCIEDCRRILKSTLNFNEVWYAFFDLALAYDLKGDYREAARWLIRMAEMVPKRAKPRVNVAQTYLKIPDFPAALKWVERALALEPNHGYAHIVRGNIHFGTGKLDRALEDYTKGVEILAPLPKRLVHDTQGRHLVLHGMQARGMVLYARGEVGEAAREFETALKAEPGYPNARFWLGKCRWDKDEFAKAAEAWRGCMGRDRLIGFFVVAALEKQNKKAEGIAWIQSLEEDLKDSWPDTLLRAYATDRVEEECRKDLETAPSAERDIRHYLLGFFHRLRGRPDEAKAAFGKCTAGRDPTHWAQIWAKRDLQGLK